MQACMLIIHVVFADLCCTFAILSTSGTTCNCCRLPGYTADDCLLEYSFYQYFPEGDWQLNFVADANLKGQSLQVQDTYLKKLYERKLVCLLCL